MEKLSEHLSNLSYLNITSSQLYAYSMNAKLSFDDILHIMSDCEAIENYHFYRPTQNIINKTQVVNCNELTSEIKENFYRLMNAKLAYPEELISNLRSLALSSFLYPEHFKTLITNWLKNTSSPNFCNDTIFAKIKTCNSIEEVLEYTHHYLLTNNDSKIRHEIKRAIDIINLKFSTAISLSYVAEQVGFSSPYLSKTFNAEVGESFNEYLTRIRMEHADKLIRESNKKMYEVAELVGIPNYRYFSKLYKKWKESQSTANDIY